MSEKEKESTAKEFNMQYHVFKDYGLVFDENRNNYGSLRKVQWVKAGAEPDESKAKLELRKIIAKDEGEQVGKGYTFATEEGPSELAEGLVSLGFGKTVPLLKSLAKRDDFKKSVENINYDPDDNSESGDMFDMRKLMSLMDDEEESEE